MPSQESHRSGGPMSAPRKPHPFPARRWGSIALGFGRLAAGLPGFVRSPLGTQEAAATVRASMADRDARFLRLFDRAVAGRPESPYRTLLRIAGCDAEEVRRLVRGEGLEGALRRLLAAGVYVTFDELKGRAPAVRGSETVLFRDTDFDNPVARTHFESSSGGSRGRSTRIRVDLEHIGQSAPAWAIWFAEHDWTGRPIVFWTPTHAGIANAHLRLARIGAQVERWFGIAEMGSRSHRALAATVHRLVRFATGGPAVELANPDEAARVAETLAAMVRSGRPPCVYTSPSAGARVALAALEQGESLAGVSFLLRAEPTTAARRQTIESAGANCAVTYGFSEGGPVAAQCARPAADDDVHLFSDSFEVLQAEAKNGEGAPLLFTSLRPASPKLLINAELGDHAILETRACGCAFDAVGFTRHLRSIRSTEKLTGLGATVVGADLYSILERTLPRRFGGSVASYQLLEQQDEAGLVRYRLRVCPSVGPLDERALVAALLEEIGKLGSDYRFMSRLWERAEIFDVVREAPLATARGKVVPFRTLAS